MKKDQPELKIFSDQVHRGQVVAVNVTVAPDFMEVDEEELAFEHPVKVRGEAYLVGFEMLVRVQASTQVTMPCRICNEPCLVSLVAEDIVHVVAESALKRGYLYLGPILREALLLELPIVAECSGAGGCAARADIEPFLSKRGGQNADSQGFQPFSDLTP